MQKTSVNGLTLFYSAGEQDTAEVIRQACKKCIPLIQENWGLDTPEDCCIYVMTSWFDFIFRSAPWSWKILLAVTIPLWIFRTKRIWALAGGWEQRYGRRRAVGVKPYRLLQISGNQTGDRIFFKEENPGRKVQSITCHELTHAFTSHLRLPVWLKEGLAVVAVDKYFDQPTVKYETLTLLEHSPGKHTTGGQAALNVDDTDVLIYRYTRGYWLTRYIDETRPGLLKELLSQRSRHNELESRISSAYGKRPEEFWETIDGVLVAYFRH